MVERVIEHEEPLKDVADELGLNHSTCKAILKVYQKEGRIGKKSRRNKVVNVIETVTYLEEDEHGQLHQVKAPTISHSRFAFNREECCQDKLEEEAVGRAKRQAEDIAEEREGQMPVQVGMFTDGVFPCFVM